MKSNSQSTESKRLSFPTARLATRSEEQSYFTPRRYKDNNAWSPTGSMGSKSRDSMGSEESNDGDGGDGDPETRSPMTEVVEMVPVPGAAMADMVEIAWTKVRMQAVAARSELSKMNDLCSTRRDLATIDNCKKKVNNAFLLMNNELCRDTYVGPMLTRDMEIELKDATKQMEKIKEKFNAKVDRQKQAMKKKNRTTNQKYTTSILKFKKDMRTRVNKFKTVVRHNLKHKLPYPVPEEVQGGDWAELIEKEPKYDECAPKEPPLGHKRIPKKREHELDMDFAKRKKAVETWNKAYAAMHKHRNLDSWSIQDLTLIDDKESKRAFWFKEGLPHAEWLNKKAVEALQSLA
jgi:hypothetical protein